MTKRFIINGKEIIQDKQVWCIAGSEHCADVIATAMNELHEENNELRLQLNSCSDQRDEFHRGARENANRVGELKGENKQLKTFLESLREELSLADRDNTILEKENEQLKKDIEYYKTERLALFEYLDKKDDLKLELKVKK